MKTLNLLITLLGIAANGWAQGTLQFQARLDGTLSIPFNPLYTFQGMANFQLTGTTLTFGIGFSNSSSTISLGELEGSSNHVFNLGTPSFLAPNPPFTSGSTFYSGAVDLSSLEITQLLDGNLYVSVLPQRFLGDTSGDPIGFIRSQIVAVPEPGTWELFGVGTAFVMFISRRLKMLSVLALAATLASAGHATPQPGKAVVTAIKGSAQSLKEGVWIPLAPGAVLETSSEVRTTGDSQADFYLGENGPVVRLTANTTLRFAKLMVEYTGIDLVVETRLELKAGRILGSVKKTSSVSRYEVKTARVIAGLKEALFDMTSDGDLRLKKGVVVVAYLDASGSLAMEQIGSGGRFLKDHGVGRLTQAEMDAPDWKLNALGLRLGNPGVPFPYLANRPFSPASPFGSAAPSPLGSFNLASAGMSSLSFSHFNFDGTLLFISPTAGVAPLILVRTNIFTSHP